MELCLFRTYILILYACYVNFTKWLLSSKNKYDAYILMCVIFKDLECHILCSSGACLTNDINQIPNLMKIIDLMFK